MDDVFDKLKNLESGMYKNNKVKLRLIIDKIKKLRRSTIRNNNTNELRRYIQNNINDYIITANEYAD